MASPIIAYQHDPEQNINYLGSDPEYWADGGPVVLPTLHTPRVSAHELDGLELASHGKIVFTTEGTAKALEVSGLGVADPAIVDTTVLDSGSNSLTLQSDAQTKLTAADISMLSTGTHRSTISVADPSDPTFHHVATPTNMTLGTGVLDPNTDDVVSGAFLETTAESFKLRHDTASITSSAGADSRIRFDAAQAHEFFVGPDAGSQLDGTGAIEILSDKVIIRKNVDLMGAINSIVTDATTLQVEDQLIRLAHTDDPATANRDELLTLGKTGMTIETVPGSYAEDGEYMGLFLDDAGAKLFVDDDAGQVDVAKAAESGLFTKEVAYYLNQGAKVAGAENNISRLEEPFWNVAGGSLHLSHTVPNGNGKAKRFSLGFRITDRGNMEMVRITKHLKWNSATKAFASNPDMTDSVNVISKFINPLSIP